MAVAALVAYLPLLLSSPTKVGADTKTYLYLDPGRLIQRAPQLWDSDVALGTVTHQTIGYLWPMGPFYWILDAVGLPDWVAQRLWIGSLMFAAGAGVWFLLRTLGWRGHGVLVAMLAYELSPYLLDYSARISAILLPWAGLGWLIALVIRSAHSGGWRDPALFALVVFTIGGLNATSLILVGLAPVLWLAHAVIAERSITTSRALATAGRIGVLCIGTSLWWATGLVIQGLYSLPVTRYTETYEAVAHASTAPEILRGLGYWFFYGNDKLGQWIEPSIEYTQGVWLLFLSFGLVVLALLAAFVIRWQHRSYFLLLLVIGSLIGIGSYPFNDPSLLGQLFKDFTGTNVGLALRSTPRAVPLVVLATAVLLGTLIRALRSHGYRLAGPFALLTVAAIVLANPAIWRIRMVEQHLHRDEELPDYWHEAIGRLEELDDGTRVWELPGSDFASYRWGNTVDPITPGLTDRGYVARELVPFGSASSADLLTGFDRFVQENTADPNAVAPIAQLMSVGDVLHRADLIFERFRTPRPGPFDSFLRRSPGLVVHETFGDDVVNVAGPEQTLLDEVHLGTAIHHNAPPALVLYDVDDPLPILRLRDLDTTTVVVGDGEGLVHAAAENVLDPDRTIFFGADLVADPELRDAVLATSSEIVITDTNRRRARRWGNLRENVGRTETAGELATVVDYADNRLPLFVDAIATLGPNADDLRSVAVHTGPYTAVASGYGNPVTYTPDDRPLRAVDNDVNTAWVVGAFSEARGEFIRLVYPEPTTVDRISLLQPQQEINSVLEPNRWITEVKISADGSHIKTVELDESSRRTPGQTVQFAPTKASVFEIEITDLDHPISATYAGVWPVGFAEITPSVSGEVKETIRTPRAFIDTLAGELDEHSLTVVLTRERSNPQEPVRDDPEETIRRLVPVSVDRRFEVSGTARLRSDIATPVIDAAVGRSPTVTASTFLPGDLRSLPSQAFDGRDDTFWTSTFSNQRGAWLQIDLRDDSVATTNDLTVKVLVDELHSVPTAFTVSVDGEKRGLFATDLELRDTPFASVAEIRLPVDLRGARSVRIGIADTEARMTRDFYSNSMTAMPIAIAEIDLGVEPLAPPAGIDTGCIGGLVKIDGTDVAVRLLADPDAAINRDEIELRGCQTIDTTAGDVEVLVSADDPDGNTWAFEIDRLVMSSPAETLAPRRAPPVHFERLSESSYQIDVAPATRDRLIVLGQSHNDGWVAKLDGTPLQGPIPVDGFANGWWVPAGSEGTIVLDWAPQTYVDIALVLSVLFVGVTIAVAVRARRSRKFVPKASQPDLISFAWRSSDTAAASVKAAVAVTVGAALFAAVNLASHTWVAVLIAAAAFVAVRSKRFGQFTMLAAASVFAITSLLIMIEQRRFRHPPDFGWPQQFEEYHIGGVVTILLVAVEYIRAVARPQHR